MKWKKALAILLALCVVFSAAGCSNKKKEAEKKEAEKKYAQEVYAELKELYSKVDCIGGDIHQVWTLSTTKKQELLANPIEYLANNTHLSEMELKYSTIVELAIVVAPEKRDSIMADYGSKSDEEIKEMLDELHKVGGDAIFSMGFKSVNPLADFCVFTIRDAYYLNGTIESIQTEMDASKDMIKSFNADYPNFEGADALKNIYTQTTAYFDFCVNPSGNLIQAMNSISDYRDSVKASMAELDFIF